MGQAELETTQSVDLPQVQNLEAPTGRQQRGQIIGGSGTTG